MTGIKTEIKELDNIIGEIPYGTVNVITAPPARLKTHIAVSITYNNLVDCKNVLFVSLEGTSINVTKRFVSRHSLEIEKPLPYYKIARQELDANEFNDYMEISKDFHSITRDRFFIADGEDVLSKGLEKVVKYYNDICQNRGERLNLIVIDYLQLIKYYKYEIYKFLELYKKICEDYNLVGILLSQMNQKDYEENFRRENESEYYITKPVRDTKIEKYAYNVFAINNFIANYDNSSLNIYPIKINGIKQKIVETIKVHVEPHNHKIGGKDLSFIG